MSNKRDFGEVLGLKPDSPFTFEEIYGSTKDRDNNDVYVSLVKTLNISKLYEAAKNNIDFVYHTGANNQKECKCMRNDMLVLKDHLLGCCSYSKHLGESSFIKPKNWLRLDVGTVGPLIPPTAGQSFQLINDTTHWPILTSEINHLQHAYATAEWRMLAPTRIVPPGNHTVVWHVTTEYMPSLAVRIPQFSQPTTVRTRMTQSKGLIALYGIAAELDSNFMDTPEGFVHWTHTLEQLAMGLDQAKNLATATMIVQLARANAHCLGTIDAKLPTLYQASKDLQRSFGIVQEKEENTWQKIIFYNKDKLRAQHGDYTNGTFSFVMPNQITTHVRVMNKAATNYAWAGPAGPAMYAAGNHLGIFSIAEMRVFSMQEFTLPQNCFHQPLESFIEFGEMVPMFYDDTIQREENPLIRGAMDRLVFTSRGFEKVEFSWAIDKCQLWGADGTLVEPPDGDEWKETGNFFPYVPDVDLAHIYSPGVANFDYDINIRNMRNIRLRKPTTLAEMVWYDKRTRMWYGATEEYLTFVSRLFGRNVPRIHDTDLVDIAVTKDNFKLMERMGIPLPFQLILSNPHKLVRAQDIVGIIPGAVECVEKVGAAWIADHINTKRQVNVNKSFGHISIRPQDVTCTRAALIIQYRSGDTTDPLESRDYEPADFRTRGSMIIIMVPFGWGTQTPNLLPEVLYLPPTDKYVSLGYTSEGGDRFQTMYGYPSSWSYENLYGWIARQFARSDLRAERNQYGLDPPAINLTCRLAAYVKRDLGRQGGGHFSRYVKGNGYWGMRATYYGAENTRYSNNFGTPEYGQFGFDPL